MIYDLIIIGADSAGLSAGIYAGRKKMNVLILAKAVGGQSIFTDSIENYPGYLKISGPELILKLKKQVEKFEVPIKAGEEVNSILEDKNIFKIKTDKEEYETKSVIIASGKNWKSLNVPGEKKFTGKGVSVCAICDAPFYDNKRVAIIGGGNSAFESVSDLSKYASKIYMIHHSEKFKGDKEIYEKLQQNDKIEFLTMAETKEIKGGDFVEGLVYEDLKSKENKEIKVDGVFVNIGQTPNSQFVENLLELNENKEIIIDHKTNQTSVAGIYAAGDVTDVKYKQIVIAAGEGAKALLSVYGYLTT